MGVAKWARHHWSFNESMEVRRPIGRGNIWPPRTFFTNGMPALKFLEAEVMRANGDVVMISFAELCMVLQVVVYDKVSEAAMRSTTSSVKVGGV